jgi:hypothetical protein
LEVVPLVVLVGELTHSESISDGTSGIVVDIGHVLGESLSEIQAQYFRDSDKSAIMEQMLVEERDHLREDLQERERFDENSQREHEQDLHSYYEDDMF